MADGTTVEDETTGEGAAGGTRSARRLAVAALPLVLLAVLLAGLFVFPPFAGVQTGEPLPDVAITHATMPSDDTVVLHVTNSGVRPVTISQVLVDDAYWEYTVVQNGQPMERPYTLGPAESAKIRIPYHWEPGWDLHTTLVLSGGATFGHTILAPQPTPGVTADLLWTLAVVGLLVGVIPVALGMAWFPAMRELSDRALHAILALSVGVLAFLAVDAGIEAFAVAGDVPGVYEGDLLVVTGIVGALVLVQAVASRESARDSPLALAYLVALGIGLHNLAEGLAIGGAVAVGHVSLGAFLVVGFMVHNVTEGPAIVAPVAREERPALWHFAALGLLAGAPVILGGWVGSFARAPAFAALALAVGVGAILQVSWEIGGLIRRDGDLATPANILAFLAGFVVMYATDLLVAL